ncbi:uncharacterized protein RSE6_05900 [Rhynchosporium secalis]|uniref:Uncharacterized protein n=1 Tax=Rhynchosporium secalis TaxID=38038 RepID=A0A1E1M903_RHYSE|nr:uncharacterized protein RSE6_05900 [Rhynchosporium secalis]
MTTSSITKPLYSTSQSQSQSQGEVAGTRLLAPREFQGRRRYTRDEDGDTQLETTYTS